MIEPNLDVINSRLTIVDICVALIMQLHMCVMKIVNNQVKSPHVEIRLSMGMVVRQPYILVSKVKKPKTKFLRYTCYLNSINNL